MFDFDTYQQKINLTNHYVSEMISGGKERMINSRRSYKHSLCFVVFKFNVKAVLNTDLHFQTEEKSVRSSKSINKVDILEQNTANKFCKS